MSEKLFEEKHATIPILLQCRMTARYSHTMNQKAIYISQQARICQSIFGYRISYDLNF
jgi:hypothetical protein